MRLGSGAFRQGSALTTGVLVCVWLAWRVPLILVSTLLMVAIVWYVSKPRGNRQRQRTYTKHALVVGCVTGGLWIAMRVVFEIVNTLDQPAAAAADTQLPLVIAGMPPDMFLIWGLFCVVGLTLVIYGSQIILGRKKRHRRRRRSPGSAPE